MPSTISPNMNLVIPTVGTDPGPDWANNLNASLNILDGHDHTTGSGVPITPNAININASLPFNSQDATLLRSARFSAQNAPLAGVSPDLGCLYVSGVDLYYNDVNGNQIRITQSASVAGASGTITGLPSGTASAAFAAISGSFIFEQATSTAANMDVGTVSIRYPGSYPTPAGNYISLQAPATLATGYAFTLPTNTPVASNALVTSSSSGVLSYTNVDNSTLTIAGGTMQVPIDNASLVVSGGTVQVGPLGVQQSMIYKRTAAAAPGAGNVGISGVASGSSVAVNPARTNVGAAITLVTTGRPVFVTIYAGPGSGAGFNKQVAVNQYLIVIQIDGVDALICNPTTVISGTGDYANVPILSHLHVPAAGAHTYQLQVTNISGGTVTYSNVGLLAYEL